LAKENGPELYWISGSPFAWRLLLTLELKHIPYTSRLLEASKGDLKKPEYKKLNPRSRVPTLKDGDFVLTESIAIMVYLDRKYPSPALFGQSERESARVWRLISESFSYLEPPLDRIVAPIYFGKVAEKADDIRAATPLVHAELGHFEDSLASYEWFGGDKICAADIVVYPFIKLLLRAAAKDAAHALDLGFLPLAERYGELARWTQRIERLPGYEKTYPPHWR
jgi:glutathione S-transferase